MCYHNITTFYITFYDKGRTIKHKTSEKLEETDWNAKSANPDPERRDFFYQ